MKKIFSLLLISLMFFGGLVACTAEPEVTEDTVIEDLVVLFVPSRDAGLILEATEPLKQLLIDTLGEKGYTVENVTIEVSTDYNAAGEALAAGTAHIGFLPGGTYVAYSGDGVLYSVDFGAAFHQALVAQQRHHAFERQGPVEVGSAHVQAGVAEQVAVTVEVAGPLG